MTTYYRPQGETGPYYNPYDSVIVNVPYAIQIAIDTVTNENSEGFVDFLCSRGATKEGLKKAAAFYVRYCDSLLACTSVETPFEAFNQCGIPHDDQSFMLFQSCVGGAILSLYHETLVKMQAEMREFREQFIKDLRKLIMERYANINEDGSINSNN